MIQITRGAVRTLVLLGVLLSAVGVLPARAATIPPALTFTPVAGGLTQPDFITNAGDGSNRLFILQQTGQIRIVKNGSLLATPFLNIAGLVSNFTGSNGEQGLLGLAFAPNYASTGIFYITYTTNTGNTTFPYTTTLARYHVSSGSADLANTSSGAVLLSIPKKYTNHNGGMLAFGPDGYLYMSMGDGGSGGDPDNNAQSTSTLLGKLLRLDVTTTPPAGQKYVIPSTNPFFGSSDPSVKKEIWAYGLRNPWRFSFDRSTGDVYIGDVGQNTEEEVDFQAAGSGGGQNYGWRILEGNLCFNPSTNCVPPPGYVAPVTTYDHGTNDSYGCSITGGYVYRGSRFPALQGVYFYGDFCSGKVLGLVRNGGTWSSSLIVDTSYSISSFGQDEQGGLYLADYLGGAVYQIGSPLVTISGNVGVAGASLAYVDGAPATARSQADGSYAIAVPQAWTGTITPSLTCYTFNPTSRSYTGITTNQAAQDYTPTLQTGPACPTVDVSIGGSAAGSAYVPPGGGTRQSYSGTAGGPVVVSSSDGVMKPIAAKRSVWVQGGVFSSYSEMMGLPNEQLSSEYYFPWYDNVNPTLLQEQFRITNLDTAGTTVEVYAGGTLQDSFPLASGATAMPSYPLDSGPVRIRSTDGKLLVASLRALWLKGGTTSSYSELMGLPLSQLSSEYDFPWYNNVNPTLLNEQLRFGNVDSAATTVEVSAGGVLLGSYDLQPGQSLRQSYSVDNGPVRVRSTNGKKIIAAIRAVWLQGGVFSSYSELMGLPLAQLASTYYFPWYNNANPTLLNEQFRFANVDTADANIEISAGGVVLGSYTLTPGQSMRQSFPVDSGVVRIRSTNGRKIIAALRAVWLKGGVFNSYSELMGLPSASLSTQYWFPWYDDSTATLNEQMRFGRP